MKKAIIFFGLFLILFAKNVLAGTEDLLITEIMYDYPGGDSNHEWLEVYNSNDEEVEVLFGSGGDAWRFFDGTNHILNLYQGSSTVSSGEYFIIAQDAEQFLIDYPNFEGTVFDTVMSLKNSSSSIALSLDGGDFYVCMTSYESSWGGAGNGNSLQYDIDSEQWDESFVLGGTPGKINSTSSVEEETDDEEVIDEDNDDQEEEEPLIEEEIVSPDNFDETVYWRDIFISELMPNPIGSDEEEWIELYNNSYQIVDISDFILQDNTTRLYKIEEGTFIGAQEYMVFYKEKTKISLNNTGGDVVSLYDPHENLRDKIEYIDLAPEGSAYAKKDYSFAWTVEPSPGAINIFPANEPPQAFIEIKTENLIAGETIIFSAEASSDPEEAQLKFKWDFGDETKGDEIVENHIFQSPGKYQVSLEVVDSENETDSFSTIVDIEDRSVDIEIQEVPKIDFKLEDLFISEFMPNPIGSDEEEWIELYNNSEKEINLLAWQLDDQDGGSKPFMFTEDFFIEPNSFAVFNRKETKITLNNTNDSVRLLTPLSEVWQEVSYEKIAEGNSWAWDSENKEWYINEIPSPGDENLINQINEQIENEDAQNLLKLQELNKGEEALTQGIVLHPPLENKSSLYLAAWDGLSLDLENLVEIYSYYKNFPKLEVGQLVTVSGIVSKAGDIPRIKIKENAQIIPQDIKIDLPTLDIWNLEDIDEDSVGSWIRVRGLVNKKRTNNIYLATEPEEEYILRTRLIFPMGDLLISKGTEVIASGILSEVSGNFRLDVWNEDNFKISKQVLGEKISSSSMKDIITTTKKIDFLANKSQSKNIWLYCIIGLVILVIIYYLDKKYINKQ